MTTIESFCNGDGEQQKTIGLHWQRNILACASRFFVHFLAVVVRPQHETMVLSDLGQKILPTFDKLNEIK